MLTTVEAPDHLPIIGVSKLLQARVCRKKKDLDGEANAIHVSKTIPFLEFDMHKQILYRMRLLGVNAVFGLRLQLVVGEKLFTTIATGTAFLLAPLPQPLPITSSDILSDNAPRSSQVDAIIKIVTSYSLNNYEKARQDWLRDPNFASSIPKHFKHMSAVESASSSKDAAISYISSMFQQKSSLKQESKLELLLGLIPMDEFPSGTIEYHHDCMLDGDNAHCDNSLDRLPQHSLQRYRVMTFTAISKIDWKVSKHTIDSSCAQLFHSMYNSMLWKLRAYPTPIFIRSIQFDFQLPDDDEVQLLMNAIALIPTKRSAKRYQRVHGPVSGSDVSTSDVSSSDVSSSDVSSSDVSSSDASISDVSTSDVSSSSMDEADGKAATPDDSLMFHIELSPDNGSTLGNGLLSNGQVGTSVSHLVQLTPMSTIPGRHIEIYFGHISLHFIREHPAIKSKQFDKFVHGFIVAVQAIAKANVRALGGNTLVGYRIDQFLVKEHRDGKHGYLLLSISGDVVSLSKQKTTSKQTKSKKRLSKLAKKSRSLVKKTKTKSKKRSKRSNKK